MPLADPEDREWRPVYVVPLLSLAGCDLAATTLDFDAAAAAGDFHVGSFDGELLAATVTPPEGVDNPDFTKSASRPHCGPVVALARSPYFPDVLLSVGDWSFHVWREGAPAPLFTGGYAAERYTAAAWSPTREAVLFLGLADGSVQCWDLVDRSHEPALVATVASTAITALAFNTAAATDKAQLLAVGDGEGMLRVNEVPSALRRAVPSEHALMSRFLDAEAAKLADVAARQVRCCCLSPCTDCCCGCAERAAMGVRRAQGLRDAARQQLAAAAAAAEEAAAREREAAEAGKPAAAADADAVARSGDLAEQEYQQLERRLQAQLGAPPDGG